MVQAVAGGVLRGKMFFLNFAKSTGKRLCRSLFCTPSAFNLIRKILQFSLAFFWQFCDFFKNTYFVENLRIERMIWAGCFKCTIQTQFWIPGKHSKGWCPNIPSNIKGIVKWAEPGKCDILLVSRIPWYKRITTSLKEWRFSYLILAGDFPP